MLMLRPYGALKSSQFTCYALTGLWGVLGACSSGTQPLDAEAEPDPVTEPVAAVEEDRALPDTQPFRVWEALRERVRQSPDHRTAEADRLVAGGDPVAIFEFVRDRIRAVPAPRLRAFQPFENRVRFGPRATLRGGVGTPRDKVELLAELLRKAGFEVAVKVAFADADHRDALVLFAPKSTPDFAPQVSDAELADWANWLGTSPNPHAVGVTDPEGIEARVVADQLLEHIGPVVPAQQLPDLSASRIPLLEVMLPTGNVWANPLFPDLAWGERGTGAFVTNATETATPLTHVRVFARHRLSETLDGASAGETLVEGAWLDSDLAGRRLVFRMRAPLDFSEALATRVDQLQAFLPSLSVEGLTVSPEEGTRLLRTGPLVTLAGDAISLDAAGRVQVNGIPLALEAGETERLAAVQHIEVEADARHFPEVRLRLFPTDAAGERVPGLRGEHFALTENGIPVWGTLRRNQDAPRVLFLVDRSTSVPVAFRGSALRALGLALAEDILTYADASVAVMGIGERADQRKPFVRDLTALADQFDAGHGSGSRLFEALSQAVRRRPTLVIMLTDGILEGPALNGAQADEIRASGVPALVLGVGAEDAAVLGELAALSDGAYVAGVSDAAEARAATLAYLEDSVHPYALHYRAPRAGEVVREIEVSTRDERVRARVAYDVPETPLLAGAFVGLYLSVTRDGETVTRTLAGLPLDVSVAEANAETMREVEASFLGSTSLLIEGGAPSWSEVLEEKLTTLLAFEPLYAARFDESVFKTRLNVGVRSQPYAAYRHMFAALATEGDATPQGPRFVLYQERPAQDEADSERRVDILPLTRWVGVRELAAQSYAAALRRAVKDMVLEGAYFERSTIAVLASALTAGTVDAIPAETLATHFAEAPNLAAWRRSAAFFGRDWTLLVPRSSAEVAFWAVHETTGTAIAVLEGGGGAGSTPGGGGSVSPAVSLGENAAYLYSLSGLAGGVWLNLEIAKAKLLAYATASIASLGSGFAPAPPAGSDPVTVVESFVCGELENAIVSNMPAAIKIGLATYNRIAPTLGLPKACP